MWGWGWACIAYANSLCVFVCLLKVFLKIYLYGLFPMEMS